MALVCVTDAILYNQPPQFPLSILIRNLYILKVAQTETPTSHVNNTTPVNSQHLYNIDNNQRVHSSVTDRFEQPSPSSHQAVTHASVTHASHTVGMSSSVAAVSRGSCDHTSPSRELQTPIKPSPSCTLNNENFKKQDDQYHSSSGVPQIKAIGKASVNIKDHNPGTSMITHISVEQRNRMEQQRQEALKKLQKKRKRSHVQVDTVPGPVGQAHVSATSIYS